MQKYNNMWESCTFSTFHCSCMVKKNCAIRKSENRKYLIFHSENDLYSCKIQTYIFTEIPREEIFLLVLIYLCKSSRHYKSLRVLNDKFLSVILPVNRLATHMQYHLTDSSFVLYLCQLMIHTLKSFSDIDILISTIESWTCLLMVWV